MIRLPVSATVGTSGRRRPSPGRFVVRGGVGRIALAAVVALVVVVGAAVPAAAQTAAQELIRQRTGQEVTQQQILERLRTSGLTRSQVRNRLLSMGLDPSLADPYFDRLAGEGAGDLPAPEAGFVGALSRMGLLTPVSPTAAAGFGTDLDVPPPSGADRQTSPRPDSLGPGGDLPVFGKALFARRTSQFRPLFTGPAPPDYRLGPGDELALVLTGDVELAYTLPVSREGFIVIPDVGQVLVNGLTLEALEDRLYDRLGEVYSGVTRSPDASTRFQVSLGRLRMNEVYVIGEVEYPGAYEVSSLATVLSALYEAGGPTAQGSFRRVQVRRGDVAVAEVDLYDYLLAADTRSDVRLEHGDVVFVPLAGPRVWMEGALPRNAIFEVRPPETLGDVIGFAGGPLPQGDPARIRIDRVLPPEERTPARPRVLVDVDLPEVLAAGGSVPVRDGDRVSVPVVGDEQKDRVVLAGSVYRPGPFELEPGMTVGELVERGGGLRPEAFRPVAHVTRLNPADSTYALLRVSLEGAGATGPDLPLQDQDSVTVFARAALETPRSVQVEGEVKAPGDFRLADGMTVEDAILSAGGFTERAQGALVEVARLEPRFERQDTVARTFAVTMEGTIPWTVLGRDLMEGMLPLAEGSEGLPSASEVELMEGDRVIVRPLPGYTEEATVGVVGQVQVPGRYPLLERDERLSSLVRRTGGFTSDAYVPGAHLIREGTLVGIDLETVLANPGSDQDVVLRPGDVLRVPLYDGTVLVRGAVAFETRVIYEDGLGFMDYIRRAGGARADADLDRANILYANGARETVDDFLWFFTDHPDVRPGSTIYVPSAPEETGTDWDSVITRGIGILGSLATIIVAVTR